MSSYCLVKYTWVLLLFIEWGSLEKTEGFCCTEVELKGLRKVCNTDRLSRERTLDTLVLHSLAI